MVPRSASADYWGNVLLWLIIATISFVAFTVSYSNHVRGEVRVLVREESGARTLSMLDIVSGALRSAPGDANAVTSQTSRIFREEDGSILTLADPGIVRYAGGTGGALSVLVASPLPPGPRTPFAVFAGGERLAWVSPADGSLQVFEKSELGTYLPVLFVESLIPNSIGFTADGTALVVSVYGEQATDVYVLDVVTQKINHLITLTGLVTVIP